MDDNKMVRRANSPRVDLSTWGIDPLGISAAYANSIEATLAEHPPSIWLSFDEAEPLKMILLLSLGAHDDDHLEWEIDFRSVIASQIADRSFGQGLCSDHFNEVSALAASLRAEAEKLDTLVARGIEARSVATAGCDPQDESPVRKDAPEHRQEGSTDEG